MSLLPIIASVLPNVLDRILPDKNAAEAAKAEFLKLQLSGELAQLEASTKVAVAQAGVNQVEAASSSLFVAGWRPAVGWICAASLGFKYIGGPLLVMVGAYLGVDIKLPNIDAEDLFVLLAGMLGLGAFRTVEKVKKVA